MAKCERNDVGSLVLNRAAGGGGFRPFSSFSGATFRKKVFAFVRCGGSRNFREDEAPLPLAPEPAQERSEPRRKGSEKLSDLLRNSCEGWSEEDGSAEETKRKIDAFEEVKRVVRDLQVGRGVRKSEAAVEVRRRAKEDLEARTTLAMLGAIPPLVGMLDSEDQEYQIAALYALLNLGIGNNENKAAIVKAGAIHKMLKLIESPNEPLNSAVSEAVVANFLGLSALDSNKAIIGSSGAKVESIKK